MQVQNLTRQPDEFMRRMDRRPRLEPVENSPSGSLEEKSWSNAT